MDEFLISPDPKTARRPLVYIIILHYNRISDTVLTLESVQSLQYDNFRVLLVDNDPTHGITREILSQFPQVEFQKNSENLGYAGGNNIGIRIAIARGAEFLLILNNDVIVETDILTELVRVMEKNELCAACQPIVVYNDRDDYIWSAGTEFYFGYPRLYLKNKERSKVIFHDPVKIFGLVGCALLMRGAAVRDIGMFDEDLFLMHEETDWCIRAKKRGYGLFVVDTAIVRHKISASLVMFSKQYLYYVSRNWLLVAGKHFPLSTYFYVLATEFFLRFPYYVIHLAQQKKTRLIQYYLKGVIDGISGISGKGDF
ncbi:MAG: glycosyltransferase family 2 protein [Methanoregula sp.]|jgi:GT2 family glycosyltransferase|uniref:glycosyltransferase family 2 protein n=1 Tax=Methanoregula sp. TaxID=2052170 RepID=UPI003D100BD7